MNCPICKQKTKQQFRPFCSQHCANIDLGRWFNGTYHTPSLREDENEADEILKIIEKTQENNDKT